MVLYFGCAVDTVYFWLISGVERCRCSVNLIMFMKIYIKNIINFVFFKVFCK
jgi:hypothetical protein